MTLPPVDRRLTRIQRNHVFEILSDFAGLNIVSFTWKDEHSSRASNTLVNRLIHPPSAGFFLFDYQTSDWATGIYVEWWPEQSGGAAKDLPQTWGATVPLIRRWAQQLEEEVSAPDLWAAAAAERTLLVDVPGNNSSFTSIERELIATHLRTIRGYLEQHAELDERRHRDVVKRLEYLQEATTRLGRFDWKGLAASTFMSIVLELGLDPVKAQGFMNLAGQLLGPVVLTATRLLGG